MSIPPVSSSATLSPESESEMTTRGAAGGPCAVSEVTMDMTADEGDGHTMAERSCALKTTPSRIAHGRFHRPSGSVEKSKSELVPRRGSQTRRVCERPGGQWELIRPTAEPLEGRVWTRGKTRPKSKA